MTNAQKLAYAEKYKECLPYDTSLFSCASGYLVFNMNGNIVAMHMQGFTLDVEGGKRSLMEFGVQFNAICRDLESKHGKNLLEHLFPNYKLEESSDEKYSREPLCCEDRDREMAIESEEKVLHIYRKKSDNQLLRKKLLSALEFSMRRQLSQLKKLKNLL